MIVPVSRTSAWVSVLFESFRTLVQVVPVSFQSQVPELETPLVAGRTAHQEPPCVQTLDCGFSPVFAETGSAVSVSQVSDANGVPAAAAGPTAGDAGAIASETASTAAWRRTRLRRSAVGRPDVDGIMVGISLGARWRLDRVGDAVLSLDQDLQERMARPGTEAGDEYGGILMPTGPSAK